MKKHSVPGYKEPVVDSFGASATIQHNDIEINLNAKQIEQLILWRWRGSTEDTKIHLLHSNAYKN